MTIHFDIFFGKNLVKKKQLGTMDKAYGIRTTVTLRKNGKMGKNGD